MKKTLIVACLLITVLLIISTVFTGCGAVQKPTETSTTEGDETIKAEEDEASKTAEIDISKKVDLIMYLIGAPAKDYDIMLEEANKKLAEDLNASVTVNWIGWADFSTKYPLLLASGDPIDLIYASTWTNFYNNAQKGAFLAIEELAKTYAPASLAEITPDFMEQSTVGGHLYAMPASFFQYGNMGYIVRGDLMKKYGMTTISGIDDYGKFLEQVLENDPQFSPTSDIASSDGLDTYYATDNNLYSPVPGQYSPFYVDINDPNAQIFNLYETDGILEYFKKMKEWGDKGLWPKSVLSNKDENMFRDGKSASRLHNQDSWRATYMLHPEWDVQFFPGGTYTFKTAAMQDGMAIPASAKNPERALMFLEKLRQDQEYYNLFTYGIEGKHFEITADDMLKPLDTEAFAPEGYCSWGFKSLKFYKKPLGSPPNWDEMMEKLSSMGVDNKFILFVPDMEPVKNELAAITSVIQQYRIPLSYGYIEDVEAGLATLREKLKAAGSDKIIAEMQSQLDKFLGK